jgi:hypothetical protein
MCNPSETIGNTHIIDIFGGIIIKINPRQIDTNHNENSTRSTDHEGDICDSGSAFRQRRAQAIL